MYVGSKTCVRVGNEVREWFPVRVGLRQGCVMSPWLFNLYIDGVVREVNARALGRGLRLVDGNDNEWELNQLLFAEARAQDIQGGERRCRAASSHDLKEVGQFVDMPTSDVLENFREFI